jgi:hypothetical protein
MRNVKSNSLVEEAYMPHSKEAVLGVPLCRCRLCGTENGKRTPKGQRRRGRLSLLTFFGEAKKVSGCRATPGNALIHGEETKPATSIRNQISQTSNQHNLPH